MGRGNGFLWVDSLSIVDWLACLIKYLICVCVVLILLQYVSTIVILSFLSTNTQTFCLMVLKYIRSFSNTKSLQFFNIRNLHSKQKSKFKLRSTSKVDKIWNKTQTISILIVFLLCSFSIYLSSNSFRQWVKQTARQSDIEGVEMWHQACYLFIINSIFF